MSLFPSSFPPFPPPKQFFNKFPAGWHFCFLLFLTLLLLMLLRQRLVLDDPKGEQQRRRLNGQMNASELVEGKEEDGDGRGQNSSSHRRRRNFEAAPGPELVPMREYLSKERLNALQALAAHYEWMKKNGTISLGMELTEKMMPGEVDSVHLDRESMGRLEMQAILDGMAGVGTIGRKLRQWMGEQAGRREGEEEPGGQGWKARRINAWDVCLGQANSLCNGHLPTAAKLCCSCQIVPQENVPPICPLLVRDVPGRVLSLAIGFPLPSLLGEPHFQDIFLARWLSLLVSRQIDWDQILILRKACLSDRLFAVQFAFLRTNWSDLGEEGEGMLFKLAEIGLEGMKSNWLWMGQALMERAVPIQLAELLPLRMERQPFFVAKIAQIPDGPCRPPWHYSSFLRCHPQHILFLAIGSLLSLGLPLGILRFWHQMLRQKERRVGEEEEVISGIVPLLLD